MPPEQTEGPGRVRRAGRFLMRLGLATLILWSAAILFVTVSVDLPMAPPGTPALGEWIGPVHVHTTASHDGGGSADDVATAAAAQGLDFVLIADHNSLRSDAEVRSGVLLAIAEEATTQQGHLLVLGGGDNWRENDHPQARNPDYAYPRIRAGGTTGLVRPEGPLVLLAHPTGPNTWDDPDFHDYDGLEIWNADNEWRTGDGALDWLHVLATLPVAPTDAMAHLLDRPEPALAWFDSVSVERSGGRSMAALCSVDAHARIDISRTRRIAFPTYAQMFSLARMHVLVGRPRGGDPARDALALYDALGAGRAYCSFDVLADGSGATLAVTSGDLQVGMGGSIPWQDGALLRSALPPAGDIARTDLLRNGEIVASSEGRIVEFDLDRPGVYRIEVSLPTPGFRGGWKPWILTNPVHLIAGEDESAAPAPVG